MEARRVRYLLLVVDYTVIYVYNRSISSARRFYGFSSNVLGFIVVAPSSYTISCDFISRSG
jgi:hypothetical protein